MQMLAVGTTNFPTLVGHPVGFGPMSFQCLCRIAKLTIVLLAATTEIGAAIEPKTSPQNGQLRVGTFAMDVTPTHYPVIVPKPTSWHNHATSQFDPEWTKLQCGQKCCV